VTEVFRDFFSPSRQMWNKLGHDRLLSLPFSFIYHPFSDALYSELLKITLNYK
jgi:hypothetical protein